jgi:glyoxylate utilization-related uncharacterized protein
MKSQGANRREQSAARPPLDERTGFTERKDNSVRSGHGISLKDTFGVQHADDEFWYRPLVLGRNLFSHVSHIPPGGGVPPYPETAERLQIEHSLYVLSGTLEVTLRDDSATLVPHTALRIPPGDPIPMYNPGPAPVTIYMSYTPSPWGPESPIKDRQSVTNHDEMLAFFAERERKVWTAAELNAMDSKLFSSGPGNLSEYRQVYLSGQPKAPRSKETPETFWIALWEADGYQHWHKPHPPDEFWFRPLVAGDKHLTYVGHIPPGGGVPPSPEEASFVEMCIYTLAGELGCIVLGDAGNETRFALPPHHAFYAPQYVPLGFWNSGGETASFVLTFTPNAPERNSISAFHQLAEDRYGWTRFSAEKLNRMVGETLWRPDTR